MIFTESTTYRPFVYPWAVEAEKKQRIDMYWHEGQIDLQDDLRQYNSKDGLKTKTMSHAQNKEIIDTSLLLFTEMDRTVAGGYTELLPYTNNNEIKTLFIQHASKEVVHQRVYALLAETLGSTDADWSSFKSYKEMVYKIDVMSKLDVDLSTPLGYAAKLTQVLLGEGIGLFAVFTYLLNFKRFGLIMGFNDVNSWSLCDETGHVENNILVVQAIYAKLSQEDKDKLVEITVKLVEDFKRAEKVYIDLVGDAEDLPKEQLKDYIDYLGEVRLFQLGYTGKLSVRDNPIEWMDWMLSGEKHDNFFEKRVTSYTHNKLSGKIDYTKYLQLIDNRVLYY